MNNSVRQHIA